jgi:molybdopterin-binding protein
MPAPSLNTASFSPAARPRRFTMKLSARNQIKGKILSITHGAINPRHQPSLKEGDTAHAVIKADSVMLGVD